MWWPYLVVLVALFAMLLFGQRKRRALMAAAAEYRALAHWRGTIRYAIVGLTVGTDGAFDVELIEDAFD